MKRVQRENFESRKLKGGEHGVTDALYLLPSNQPTDPSLAAHPCKYIKKTDRDSHSVDWRCWDDSITETRFARIIPHKMKVFLDALNVYYPFSRTLLINSSAFQGFLEIKDFSRLCGPCTTMKFKHSNYITVVINSGPQGWLTVLLNEVRKGVRCMLVKFFARKAAWLKFTQIHSDLWVKNKHEPGPKKMKPSTSGKLSLGGTWSTCWKASALVSRSSWQYGAVRVDSHGPLCPCFLVWIFPAQKTTGARAVCDHTEELWKPSLGTA